MVFERDATDKNCIFIFSFCFFVWVGIVVYALAFAATHGAETAIKHDATKECAKVGCHSISNSIAHPTTPTVINSPIHKKIHDDLALGEFNFYTTLYNFLGSLAMCLILVLIYIWCMSKFTRTLCFISIGFIELLFVGWIVGFLFLPTTKKDPDTYLMAIIPALFFLLFNCILYCNWAQMEVAIAVIGVAADFYAETKRVILVSLVYFIIHLIVFIVSAFATVALFASKEDGKKESDINFWVFIVGLFIYIWIGFVIHNIVGYTASVAVSTYYFSSNRHKQGEA